MIRLWYGRRFRSVRKDAQALGLLATITPSTLLEWKTEMEGRTLDEDKLMRISLLIGIFKALNLCYGQDLADCWVTLLTRIPSSPARLRSTT
jgi:hypothetical protein